MSRMCAILALTSTIALTFTNGPVEARHFDFYQYPNQYQYYQPIHHHALKASHLRYRITAAHHGRRHVHHFASSRSLSLAGVTPVLAGKARQIVSSCGSTIISTVSPRGHRSNHPIGRAVDIRGNPSCIYAQLKGWPGGYSIDYAKVQHVHISYNPGGQEWGLHFAHGGGHYGSTRYASRSMAYRYAGLTGRGAGQTLMLYTANLHQPQ